MWEGCAGEGGSAGPVAGLLAPSPEEGVGWQPAAAGVAPDAVEEGPWGMAAPPGAAQGGAEAAEQQGADDGGEAADESDWVPGRIPAWLRRRSREADAWRALLRDGWGAMQLGPSLPPGPPPPELARVLEGVAWRAAPAGGAHGSAAATDRWASLAQLALLLGLHRALHGAMPPELGEHEASALAGFR
jgi:hypothetical protein